MLTKLENYRVFCKVAQHKSFSGAAQELFLSQPAVSQSVRQLEELLGMQLFVRSSKKVELTPQGSILYEYASSALGLLESAEQQLSGLQTLGAGQLRLGAGDITARHLLLPALERFHQLYPKVHLSIFNRASAAAWSCCTPAESMRRLSTCPSRMIASPSTGKARCRTSLWQDRNLPN